MRIFIIALLLLIGLSALIFIPSGKLAKINGVSLVSPPREIEPEKLSELKAINASWVAVIPYGFSRSGQPAVTFDHQRQWWGERTDGACELIKYAHDQGMKVMLKPHVWVMGEGWTGDFQLKTEEDWKKWEQDYSNYILNHAKAADSMGVELFCIGTEYRYPAKERSQFWKALIREVKKVYDGPLTYASNWDNFMNISWWDEVDYIGVDSYFPLAEGDNPSLDEIKNGWAPMKEELKELASKWNRPVLFTEYGFQSVNGGAGKHWEVDKSSQNVNMEVQKTAYEATFESVWDEPWFVGGFLWKWHLTTRGAEHNVTRFTPQGKPAEKIIAEWYLKSR